MERVKKCPVLVRPCCFDGQMQFVIRLAQMLFRSYAVTLLIVVVGCTSPFHFVNRFLYVFVNVIEVMPISHLPCKQRTSNKGQADGGYGKQLLHTCSSKVDMVQQYF